MIFYIAILLIGLGMVVASPSWRYNDAREITGRGLMVAGVILVISWIGALVWLTHGWGWPS